MQTVVRFTPSVQVDRVSLRKLAQLAPRRPYALVMGHSEEGLYCDGLGAVERLRGQAFVKPQGLYVTIQGPGWLSLSGPSYPIMEWRGQRVHRALDVSQTTALSRVARAATVGRLEPDRAEQESVREWPLKPEFEKAIGLALGAVIAGIHDEGKGGCIVVLPPGMEVPPRDIISLKYRTHGPKIAQTYLARNTRSSQEGEDLAVRPEDLKESRAAARLGSVDGCLVFDTNLHCVGFAAMIRNVQPVSCKRVERMPLLDATPPANAQTWDVNARGMRHQSAASLCTQIVGAVVFVISQDGEIRTMWSANGTDVLVEGPAGVFIGWTGTLEFA